MSVAFHVPDDTYRALRLVAQRRGRTPEEIFAEWVRAQSEGVETTSPPHPAAGTAPLARFIGAFEADEPDLTRRHDHYLAEAAADAHDAGS